MYDRVDIERFLAGWKRIRSRTSRASYRGFLGCYQAFLDARGLSVETARAPDIRRFAEEVKQKRNYRTKAEGVSDITVESHLAAVSAYYKWLQQYRRETRNPAAEYRFERRQAPRIVLPIENKALDRMQFAARTKADAAMVSVFRGGGFRVSELESMNKQDFVVNPGAGGTEEPVLIVRVRGKGNKVRDVAIRSAESGIVLAYLEERWEDGLDAVCVSNRKRRMSVRTIQRHISRLARAAGLGHAHPHQLRHSYGHESINSGVPVPLVAKQLGHDDEKVTYRYGSTSEQVAEAQYRSALSRAA